MIGPRRHFKVGVPLWKTDIEKSVLDKLRR